MQHITIVIPTRNRVEKLKRTLRSIPAEIDVWVVCDRDHKTIEELALSSNAKYGTVGTKFIYSDGPGAVACRNEVCPKVPDGFLYATDDIAFKRGALEQALAEFNLAFPDDDGVLGLRQNRSHHPAGVGLMGKIFLDRYPGRRPFFPGYFHFACQEILWLAGRAGKFKHSESVMLDHFHPAFLKEEMDQTHIDARVHKKEDHDLIKNRERAGMIWGNCTIEEEVRANGGNTAT